MSLFGNPQTQVAFSVFENKGVFALLLGSGLSRSAEIPTGWEITLDLVRRVATAEGVEEQPDWAQWYREKYGNEPDYSALLDALSSTPAERRQIIHSYIEPDDEDRAEGRKVPTAGHKAIAQLVRDGFIRVIVTTNFDRLMENALIEVGVQPTVVGSPDALKGAEPLAHTACYILKLHGDYKDARILNTEDELGAYPEEYNTLLDRIIDEYGLIVCGWSGEWDAALRAAILRAPNRRYPLFWATRGALKGRGKELCDHRRGVEVPIQDADGFFLGLVEQVRTLAESQRSNPVEVRLLISRAKRYLAKPEHRIQFADLVSAEVSKIIKRMSEADMSCQANLDGDELARRINVYNGTGEGFIKLCGLIGRWGDIDHLKLLGDAIRRLWIALRPVEGGFVDTSNIRGYVPVMACHAAMLSMVEGQRWDALRNLLNVSTSNGNHSSDTLILNDLFSCSWEGNEERIWAKYPGLAKKRTPFTNLIYSYFEQEGSVFSGGLGDFQQDYLLMEALPALMSLESNPIGNLVNKLNTTETSKDFFWMPVHGRISWDTWGTKRLLERLAEPALVEILIKAGFGGGSRDSFSVYVEHLRRNISHRNWM